MYDRNPEEIAFPPIHEDLVLEPIEIKTSLSHISGEQALPSSADAYLCDADYARIDDSKITVYDFPGSRRDAIGADDIGNDSSGNPRRGALGLCMYDPMHGRRMIVTLQRLARIVYGQVNAAFSAADGTVTLKNVALAYQDCDQMPPLDGSHHLVVYNTLNSRAAGNADSYATATLAEFSGNRYSLLQCPRPGDLCSATIVADGDTRVNVVACLNGVMPAVMPANTLSLVDPFGLGPYTAGESVLITGRPNESGATGAPFWQIIGRQLAMSPWQTVVVGPTLGDTIQIRGPGLETR